MTSHLGLRRHDSMDELVTLRQCPQHAVDSLAVEVGVVIEHDGAASVGSVTTDGHELVHATLDSPVGSVLVVGLASHLGAEVIAVVAPVIEPALHESSLEFGEDGRLAGAGEPVGHDVKHAVPYFRRSMVRFAAFTTRLPSSLVESSWARVASMSARFGSFERLRATAP